MGRYTENNHFLSIFDRVCLYMTPSNSGDPGGTFFTISFKSSNFIFLQFVFVFTCVFIFKVTIFINISVHLKRKGVLPTDLCNLWSRGVLFLGFNVNLLVPDSPYDSLLTVLDNPLGVLFRHHDFFFCRSQNVSN